MKFKLDSSWPEKRVQVGEAAVGWSGSSLQAYCNNRLIIPILQTLDLPFPRSIGNHTHSKTIIQDDSVTISYRVEVFYQSDYLNTKILPYFFTLINICALHSLNYIYLSFLCTLEAMRNGSRIVFIYLIIFFQLEEE